MLEILFPVLLLIIPPLYVIYKPPACLIDYLQRRWPDILWRVQTSNKIVALTIDDAPSEYTDEILQILKAHDAKATFFVIGSQVADREETLVDLVRSGNELGNHAMYDEPSRNLSDVVLEEQIRAVQDMIHNIYDTADVERPQKYFRPGSGFFSRRMRELLRRLVFRLVLGDVYPHDPQVQFWRVNAAHILSTVRPGSIIICHDRRSWTAPMLRKVLSELGNRGYRVVTVTDLLEEIAT
jgi:peptidoglycan/xylan/chitin deacetylase (PgdA/CDA1 family)